MFGNDVRWRGYGNGEKAAGGKLTHTQQKGAGCQHSSSTFKGLLCSKRKVVSSNTQVWL